MSEEKNQEPTAENIGAGDQPPAVNLIERSDAIAKRMEEAIKRSEEILARNEEIYARQRLAGRADAGQVQKSEEEVTQERIQAEAKAIVSKFIPR